MISSVVLGSSIGIAENATVKSAGKQANSRGRMESSNKPKKYQVVPVVPQDALESIVAVVDGDPITMSDFRDFVLGRKESLGTDLNTEALQKIFKRGSSEGKLVLESYVQERMLAKEAEAGGISATSEEIDLYISEVAKQNNLDAHSFEEVLKSRGIALEKYKEQVREDIIKTRLISTRVRNKINVIDEEILKAAKKEKSGSGDRGKIHLEQILLHEDSTDPDAREYMKDKTQSLRDEVEEEQSLKSIDEDDYSDLGFVRPSDLRSELEKEVRKLSPGKTTPVVCYESSCAFVRRVADGEKTEDSEQMVPTLSDSDKEAMRKQLFEEKFQEALERYLKTDLPEKYQVEMKW